ncbi:hypothetical protein [Cytobacillus sp. IB215665]|uniref:hypothetical protein n=1 Tax=Cytobacillus sp. IB215665 TaxID=3097357 RepID=UPI002A116F25|nr:hypothetical protein [Cytobacillus sp. IB215665]MDX8366194.1 hypothetical protein [Cytobacillus sp. IB215665]
MPKKGMNFEEHSYHTDPTSQDGILNDTTTNSGASIGVSMDVDKQNQNNKNPFHLDLKKEEKAEVQQEGVRPPVI